MHFLTLAILEIPEIREDKELDKQIVEALKELELQKQIETKNFMLDFTIGGGFKIFSHHFPVQ